MSMQSVVIWGLSHDLINARPHLMKVNKSQDSEESVLVKRYEKKQKDTITTNDTKVTGRDYILIDSEDRGTD